MAGSKYAALVAAAQKNAKSVWVLADELLAVCPNRSRSEIRAAHAVLVEAGYGYTPERLSTLAYTAERWPKWMRCLEASFKAHEVLNPREDRAKLIRPNMTLTEAHKAAGHSTAARTSLGDGGPNGEIIAAASQDEATMRSLVEHDEFRSAFIKHYAEQEREEREEAEVSQRKRTPSLVRASNLATATTEINRAIHGVAVALDALKDEELTLDDRDALLDRADRLENALGWLKDRLRSGAHSLENDLEALLRDSA